MNQGSTLRTAATATFLAAPLLLAPACSRIRDLGASGSASASSNVTTTSAASAATTNIGWSARPNPDGSPRPWADEAGRQGKCIFTGWKGTGDDKKSMFRLELPPGKTAEHIQTWQFYYDASGKQLDEYPSATTPSFGDDAGVQDLGASGHRIKDEVDTVECEITEIRFKDGTAWWNKNLMASGLRRPKGGFPASMLRDHAGERVAVVSVDPKNEKVTLKNLTDRPVHQVNVELICWKGKEHEYDDHWTDVVLAGNATITTKVEVRWSKLEGCDFIEGAVSRVEYADDSVFRNLNLEGSARP